MHSMGGGRISIANPVQSVVVMGSPKEVQSQYKEFRRGPKLLEKQMYAEFERQREYHEKQRALGQHMIESPEKTTRMVDPEVIERQKREERELKNHILSDLKKP